MRVDVRDLRQLLAFWEAFSNQHDYASFGLIVCTYETAYERKVWEYLSANKQMLDEMSGVYCALTILGQRPESGPSDVEHRATDLSYLHEGTVSDLGSRDLYELTHHLEIDLDRLPYLLVTADPFSAMETLMYGLAEVAGNAADMDEVRDDLTFFLRGFFAACRKTSAEPTERRLHALQKEVEKRQRTGGPNWLAQVRETGMVAQVIEGILRGLPS